MADNNTNNYQDPNNLNNGFGNQGFNPPAKDSSGNLNNNPNSSFTPNYSPNPQANPAFNSAQNFNPPSSNNFPNNSNNSFGNPNPPVNNFGNQNQTFGNTNFEANPNQFQNQTPQNFSPNQANPQPIPNSNANNFAANNQVNPPSTSNNFFAPENNSNNPFANPEVNNFNPNSQPNPPVNPTFNSADNSNFQTFPNNQAGDSAFAQNINQEPTYPNNQFTGNLNNPENYNSNPSKDFGSEYASVQNPDPNAYPQTGQINYDQTNPYPPQNVSSQAYENDALETPPNINQTAGNYNEFGQPDLANNQANPEVYNQNSYPQNSDFDSNLSSNPEPQPNTFEEKKSGNKLLLIAVIAIVAVLLIVTIGLFAFINLRSKNSPQNSSSSSSANSTALTSSQTSDSSTSQTSNSSQNSNTSNNSSGSSRSKTPAENAKIRNATTIVASWLQQKFFNNGLKDGSCQNQAICGESADPDSDGLTNLEEYNYDIDPLNDDTDNDGISDGNEVKIYLTSPKESDSDTDKVSDGQELANCYDPISTTTSKMTPSKLNNIAANANLYPVRDKTSKTIKAAGGNDTDVENGYIAAKCTSSTVDLN